MRRAIERIVVYIDWEEDIFPTGTRWQGKNDRFHEVWLDHDPSTMTWGVEVKKGINNSSLRRVTNLCQDRMSKADAVKFAAKIMQDHVSGKV